MADGLGRVLVVEDDEVIRSLIALNLELEGFEVSTAVDGSEAMAVLKAVDPVVVTLDAMMPNVDGYEAVRRIRADPDTAHVKVLMVSARAQRQDVARADRAGVDSYLTKPFDPGELVSAVRRLAGLPA
ncbi:MAG: response regulator [Actinomycetota bacterium]|nr:response regulator [Actinomycetota bacterium]